jgi:hypothetical protein
MELYSCHLQLKRGHTQETLVGSDIAAAQQSLHKPPCCCPSTLRLPSAPLLWFHPSTPLLPACLCSLQVKFAGWARMALPLQAFRITEVRKPAVGDIKPAAVTADIVISLRTLRPEVRGREVRQCDTTCCATSASV